MITKDLLFAVLRSRICREKIDKEVFVPFDEEAQINLYKLSTAHDLAHIVASELFENGVRLSEKVASAFKKQQMIAVFRYEKLKKELLDVCKAFEEAKIEYTPLKGSVLRNYYDQPWMRTSSDIDILVSENDLDGAVELLVKKLGCEIHDRGAHDVVLIAPSQFHIEIHYALTEHHNLRAAREILENYREYLYTSDGLRFEMKDELFYFYHIDHMTRHFQSGGCGIKPIMDLWILEHKVPHDNEKREELLKKGGLLTFANEAKRLMRVWFEHGEHSEITKLMEEYLLSGGVYGTLENSVALNQHKRGGKFRYALSRIFLKYDSLKYAYPILQKHKWLFPFMQVRRWFKLLFFGGVKRSVRELRTNATVTDDLSQKTQMLLERLEISEK